MASNIKHFYGCICLPYMIFCEVFVFLFFKLKKHYFWLHQALVAAHGIFLFVCGLLSVVAWALNFAGSVVSVHGLSCPEASSILFPPPGTETVSSSLKSRFLTTIFFTVIFKHKNNKKPFNLKSNMSIYFFSGLYFLVSYL